MNNYDNHNSDRAYYHGDVDADSMSSGGGRVSTGSGGGRCSLNSSDSSLCHSGEDCSSGGGAAAVHYTVTPKTVTAATATAATNSAQKPAESGTDSSGPAQSCTQTRQQLRPSANHSTSTATAASSNRTNSGTTSSSVGREWCLSDFEIGATLGQGAFGAVWLAREKKSQFLTALKRIRKSLLVESGMEMQLRREVEIQRYTTRSSLLDHILLASIAALYRANYGIVRVSVITKLPCCGILPPYRVYAHTCYGIAAQITSYEAKSAI
eukprot:13035-Heterococcus_DN1.PRE.2